MSPAKHRSLVLGFIIEKSVKMLYILILQKAQQMSFSRQRLTIVTASSSYRFAGLGTRRKSLETNCRVPEQLDFLFAFPSDGFKKLGAPLTSPMACWSVSEVHPDTDTVWLRGTSIKQRQSNIVPNLFRKDSKKEALGIYLTCDKYKTREAQCVFSLWM